MSYNTGSAQVAQRLYRRFQNSFPTLIAALDENSNSGSRAGEVLAVIATIAKSMAAHSINPSEPPSNWHRAYKPHYLAWLRAQQDEDENEMEVLVECDDDGHQISFINELRTYVQTKVRSTVSASVRNSSRHEFDHGDEIYPAWAVRVTSRSCKVINDDTCDRKTPPRCRAPPVTA
ncbi:unnamed protein product [Periconia digitata]|uniref:Uncharacterized protein n=1 Tax=Periconia digitata TaxID=1303443 RepID=A0A9W4U8L2_9PLEO|nr:unnamed protein product [Periconia digitata]